MAISKRKNVLIRVVLANAFMLVFGLLIIFRSVQISVGEGEYWRNLSDSLSHQVANIEGERGNIYTADGNLLATSLPFFEIRMDFRSEAMTDDIFNEHVDSLAFALAQNIGKYSYEGYKKELIAQRARGNRYYLIKRNVNFRELNEMKTWPFFKLGKYKSGLITLQTNKRKMPYGTLAHRTIGYVRDENRYKVGLEGKFNQDLQGEENQVLMKRLAGGARVPVEGYSDELARPGYDIYTTLDINLQDVAETALKRALLRHGADHGSVVIMETSTGAIKAIANLGKDKKGQYYEKFNYAVGESTEPGSTFKLAAMIALLEDGHIDIKELIDLEGGEKQYYDQVMKDAYPPKEDTVSIKRAFATSSNVGISKLVTKHYQKNPSAFYEHLVDLGLNKPLGVEINGEAQPTIKPPKEWSGVSLPWISVGYEVSLTPLQTLSLYNAVANNGKMMKPYLVQEIRDFDQVVRRFKPQVINSKICSRSTLSDVRNLLESVVEEGSAKSIKSANYTAAGKTGTAQIADKNSGYTKRIYQSSFAGYFPADKPQYSCIVVINSPSSGAYYGSAVAAPVFKEIMDKVYARSLDMQDHLDEHEYYVAENLPRVRTGNRHDYQTLLNELGISHHFVGDGDWVRAKRDESAIALHEHEVIEALVPNVYGMGLRDAIYLMENQGLRVEVRGQGKVIKQSVRPGVVARGQKVVITLS